MVIKHDDPEALQAQIKSKLFKILGQGYTVDADYEEIEEELGTVDVEDLNTSDDN